MSVAAKKWVRRHARVQGPRRTVLAELAWAGDDQGRGARLSHRQLAGATGLSRRTVQRALKQLESEDLIRRHSGGRDHCAECVRAGRGVVVFDVVIPEQLEESLPGQLTLLAGAAHQRHDRRQDTPAVAPVANRHQRHCDAGTGVTVTHLEEKRTEEGQQQQERAPEKSSELADTVERVIGTLRRCPRLFIDQYAIEGALMRAGHLDIDAAAAEVVALASDPAYRLPKGGAAMMLLHQLGRQRPAPTPLRRPGTGRFTPSPQPADEDFSKYDRAMGLA